MKDYSIERVAMYLAITACFCTLVFNVRACSQTTRESIAKISGIDTQTARVAICAIGEVTETYCAVIAAKEEK